MKVHLYRWGELKRELRGRDSRFKRSSRWTGVGGVDSARRGLRTGLRAGGWIVFAARRRVSDLGDEMCGRSYREFVTRAGFAHRR